MPGPVQTTLHDLLDAEITGAKVTHAISELMSVLRCGGRVLTDGEKDDIKVMRAILNTLERRMMNLERDRRIAIQKQPHLVNEPFASGTL